MLFFYLLQPLLPALVLCKSYGCTHALWFQSLHEFLLVQKQRTDTPRARRPASIIIESAHGTAPLSLAGGNSDFEE